MDEKRAETTHRGHKIEAHATQSRTGWQWCYSIDGCWYPPSRITPPDAETALRQAVAAAKSRIDDIGR